MFGTIRKHQNWLWAVIIALTILSFVVFFSPYQRLSDSFGRGPGSLGKVDGEPVTTETYGSAWREVKLQYFLRRGNWPDRDPAAKQSGFNEEREVYYRLLLLRKIKEFDIQVSGAAVAQLAADVLRGMQKSGPVPLSVFEQRVLAPSGLSAADFERFLRHELALQQLINVVGVTGTLMPPQEAQALYRHEHEEVVSQLVFFAASNYLSRATVSAEAVGRFFTNRMAAYRVPERVQVSFVKFELTNYWSAGYQAMTNRLTNMAEVVDSVYRERGTNYYSEAKSPEAAKQLIREEIHRNFALELARSNASSLADTLLDKTPVVPSLLAAAAKEMGRPLQVTAPFDRDRGPADPGMPANFAKAAFALTAEEPIAGPIVGEDGAYVIALQTNLPSYIPSLDSIRARATEDYRLSEAVRLAQQAGEAFYQTLTNGLAHDKTFATACREASLKPVLLPAFSRSDRSLGQMEEPVPIGLLQEVAFKVPPGNPTQFVPLANGGFILFVQSRQPMDETKMQQDMPKFLAMIRQTAQNEAFNEWFRKQAETGLRDTPLARPPTTMGSAGAN